MTALEAAEVRKNWRALWRSCITRELRERILSCHPERTTARNANARLTEPNTLRNSITVPLNAPPRCCSHSNPNRTNPSQREGKKGEGRNPSNRNFEENPSSLLLCLRLKRSRRVTVSHGLIPFHPSPQPANASDYPTNLCIVCLLIYT